MAKKGVKTGPRITVFWAKVKRKVDGKSVDVSLTSQIVKTTADLFGLKAQKAGPGVGGATVKTIKTKKGSRVILSGGNKTIGTRKMYASTDGKVFHQFPVPVGLSLAKAYAILKAGKKAYIVKFQGGTPKIVGSSPVKDTKSKSALAKTTK